MIKPLVLTFLITVCFNSYSSEQVVFKDHNKSNYQEFSDFIKDKKLKDQNVVLKPVKES